MRPIGTLEQEAQARQLYDLLLAKGIEGHVDQNRQGRWEVWVLDDIHMEAATALLERFGRRPDDPDFVQAIQAARQKRQEQANQAPRRARVVNARAILYTSPVPLGLLSMVFIGISVAVTLLTYYHGNERLWQFMSITQFQRTESRTLDYEKGLPEVRRGQVWRLFTPMFLHFGALHILFNMLWLRDLGSMIEARKGSWQLLLLALVLAGLSNIGQYLHTGPTFGGMSGVVYGLLGYIWMQGKFNPASKLSLQPQTVTFMIVWFFVCLSGAVGPIANTAHAVGLAAGVAWGFFDARMKLALRRY